jgi:hypothetical protein
MVAHTFAGEALMMTDSTTRRGFGGFAQAAP